MLPVVILAGGLGTRMRPLTDTRPKALLPVLGRPFCDWQLQLLADRGAREVVYSIGHLGTALRDHVGDGSAHGLSVTWVDEGEARLGTGGALRLAAEQGALAPAFFVLYGDSYLPIDLEPVERAWAGSGAPALMTVLRNEGRWDSSNVDYEGGRVRLYDKGRSDLAWIDYGLEVLTRDLVAALPEGPSDLAGLLHRLSVEGKLAGYEVSERFYEAGSPGGLRDLEEHLSGGGRHGSTP